ncbi:MAG: hypothetical protein ICV60_02200 [Pyrinomonadaceae bacterium]|nr:hypothetical protein [Pyrinomonadaceae bacterium]
MLEDNEWIELLDYLLRRLTEIGAVDIVDEIRIAVSTRVIEETDDTQESGVPLSYYREVGTKETRLPTPKEAVKKAVEVIQTRLDMLPSIGDHTVKMLKRESSDIVWRSEDRGYLFLSNIQEFSASDLIVPQNDRQVITDMLKRLIILIQES